MGGSVHGRGVLAGVRNVLAVSRRCPSRLHLSASSTSPSISLRLIHPPALPFHPPARHYTLALPRQPCLLSTSALPRLFTASACLTTSPPALKTWPTADGGPPQKKRQDKSQLVTLIDAQDKVSTTSLEQAQRLAKHRDLKLVKIEDPSLRKGSKEVYRLLTGKQYFEEQIRAKKSDKKASVGVKDEKILPIGGKISPHDLAVKLQSVTKWLSKGHQIKVTISSRKATKEDKENVFSTIEEEVKKVKGRILQRHDKMEDIRFYIAPPKVREKEGVASSEPAQEGGGHVEGDKATDPTTV